ncbi:MAG: RyR domain-containing protein [Caulobacteraceae bacterium]
MHGHGDDKWVRGRRWLDRILIIFFFSTFALGVIGFSQGVDASLTAEQMEECVTDKNGWYQTDPFYRFLLLFELGEGGLLVRNCYSNVALALARFAGPLTVFLGIVRLLWNYVAERLDEFRVSWLSGHVVIVGLGARGRAFMNDPLPRLPIAVVESKPDDDTRAFVERHHGLLIVGDGSDPKVLKRARAAQARAVLTSTGDDEVNLQVAEAAMSLVDETPDLRVMISDPLVRRSLAGAKAGGRLDVLSLEELAARAFTDRVRLFELVELAAAPRLHVVFAGKGRLLAAMAAQILRANVFPDLGKPALTLLSSNPESVRDELELAFPGTGDVADVLLIAFDPAAQPLDQALAERIAAAGPVTAIISVGDSGQKALRPALGLRDGLKRLNLWRAPVFFASSAPESVRSFTAPLAETSRLAEVFEPFAVSASLCDWAVIDALDATARGVHDNYRRAHGALSVSGERASNAVEALRPWEQLPSTYKRANRRAADHIAAKLLAAGCMAPAGSPELPVDLNLIEDDEALDRLAELEHEGWAVDRRLEGWRPGKERNHAALIHDCLLPFDELTKKTQDLDREQIKALNNELLARAPLNASSERPNLVRRDLWVGVIGPLDLSAAEARWWDDFVGAWVRDTLAPAARGNFITLVSPLAPGGGLTGARSAAEALKRTGLPWRLIVPEARHYPDVVADFREHWEAGAAGMPGDRADTWPEAAAALKSAAYDLVRQRDENRVVPLAGAPRHADGRQRAYMAARCHLLLLALSKDQGMKADGVVETLSWREAPSAVPAELVVRARHARPLPPGLEPTVVVGVPRGL